MPVEHSRGSIDIGRGLVPSSSESRSSAAASGSRSSYAQAQGLVSSLGAFGRVNEKGHASKMKEPSLRRPSLQTDRRNSTSTRRRKSTGSDRSQQQGDGVERVSRTLRQLDVDRDDLGKGQGGAEGGGAYGRTASTHRNRQAIINPGSRRASVPPGGAAGRFVEERSAAAGSAGKHVPSAISSLAGAPNRTTLDVWEEAAAAGGGGGRWALGGKTQGDYLLQQRARRDGR